MISSRLQVLRRETEQRAQQIATGDQDRGDRHAACRSCAGEPDAILPPRARISGAKQDRRHHQILKQQHSDGDPAERRCRPALLLEKLHHHRGRGHCERQPENDRGCAGRAQQPTADTDGDSRSQELEAADAGDKAAQRPQPLHRHLDADEEQQEHDAKFGEGLDARAILDGEIAQPWIVGGQMAEAVRPDRDADQQKAHHRADARAVEQRHDQARRPPGTPARLSARLRDASVARPPSFRMPRYSEVTCVFDARWRPGLR